MREILERWNGTPYACGQAASGAGVFCSAFVSRVLDELYRKKPTPLPAIPDDASFHDPAASRAGLRWFLSSYPDHARVENGEVEAGDVLVTAPLGGGPGHGIIVGPDPHTMWESRSIGVCKTGLSAPSGYTLSAVYRLTDKETWA